MATIQRSLSDHIEQYLGTIQCAWVKSDEGKEIPFHVLKCSGGQVDQATAFATIGLSNFPLMPLAADQEQMIRHELLILTPTSFGNRNIPALLQQLGLDALKRNTGYVRGEVVEREGLLFKGAPFSAFYVAPPNILPDEFAVYTPDPGHRIVFAWMVPITKAEAQFVRAHGWNKFEDALEAEGADMVDFDREPIM